MILTEYDIQTAKFIVSLLKSMGNNLQIILVGKKSFLAKHYVKFLNAKKIKFFHSDIINIKNKKKSFYSKITHIILFTHNINKKKLKDNKSDIKNLEIIKSKIDKKIKLIFFSTPAIRKHNYIKENVYYYSKKACETYIKKNFLNYLIIRFPNIYGINQRKNYLIPKLINRIKIEKKVILDNYLDTRDCIYVSDFNKILFRLINSRPKKIINICSGNIYSIQEICEMIKEISNSNKKIYLLKKNSKVPKGHLMKKNIDFNFISLRSGLKKIIKQKL